MKIVIATGIYPPDIGGPAQYARGVFEAWRDAGHEVRVLAFRFERKLPTGIRHLYYFLRVLFALSRADFVFSPDTFSAALPALLAARVLRKKFIVRTGGDFLWEQYVERTGDLVLLRHFYKTRIGRLNLKERIVFRLVRSLFARADATIFSTAWQRDIFREPYRLDLKKCFIVENYYGEKQVPGHSYVRTNVGMRKMFVGGTRPLKWKNIEVLRRAFAAANTRHPELVFDIEPAPLEKFLEKIQSAYAVILASLGDVSPNTILEAIQFGKPFILTQETGLYDKLKDIGVWVNPEDVADIAEKIEWLADEQNYAAQCRKVVAFSFTHSYEEIADELITIYRNAR